jgi:hypothetical protein
MISSRIRKKRSNSAGLSEPPIFVIGYMHSGTTLLINILKSHSTVFSGNRETKYFMHLPMIRKTFPNLKDDKVLRNFVYYVIAVVKTGFSKNDLNKKGKVKFELAWFGGDEKRLEALMEDARKNRNHESMFALVSDHMTQATGKKRWVEKTPTHIFHLDEIIETIPDALFVEIVRDPRDVLASKKTRRQTVWSSEKYAGQREKKNLEKAFDPVWDSLSWRSAIRAGQIAREKYPDKIFSIRYEDLTRNPEEAVKKICSFLKMDFEPQMLDVSTRNSAVEEKSENAQKGVVTTSVGRWRTVLSAAEAAVIQGKTGKEMDSLGYERAEISFRDKTLAPFIFLKSSFEFVQRSYRRWRFGGWLYFQNVLANYWQKGRLLVFHAGKNSETKLKGKQA